MIDAMQCVRMWARELYIHTYNTRLRLCVCGHLGGAINICRPCAPY